jgi:hypothetical protein
MGYLNDAEDLFRDIDAIETRQKYKDALKVQTQRNAADEFRIRNYDTVAAQRDALTKNQLDGFDWAQRILYNMFKELEDNGLDSEVEVVPKDPGQAKLLALKHKAIGLIKAQASQLYKKEFKVELEERFRQEFQKQVDQIIEAVRKEHSRTPADDKVGDRNLAQTMQDIYPFDVFKSLQKSWKIRCNECSAFHDHVFTENDVTTLLRHSSVKKAIEETTFRVSRFGIMWPKFDTHVQVVKLADVVRRYIQSRLEERQGKR